MARITGIVSCSCNEVCLCVMNVSWLQEQCKHWVHLALLAKWASPHYPVVGRIDGVECENDLLFWKLWGLLFGCNKISTFFFFYIFFIMQEVMSKHGLLNIEELNSSDPSNLVLFAEVLRQNTSQKFLPAYQIRRVFTSASQHWKVTFIWIVQCRQNF